MDFSFFFKSFFFRLNEGERNFFLDTQQQQQGESTDFGGRRHDYFSLSLKHTHTVQQTHKNTHTRTIGNKKNKSFFPTMERGLFVEFRVHRRNFVCCCSKRRGWRRREKKFVFFSTCVYIIAQRDFVVRMLFIFWRALKTRTCFNNANEILNF